MNVQTYSYTERESERWGEIWQKVSLFSYESAAFFLPFLHFETGFLFITTNKKCSCLRWIRSICWCHSMWQTQVPFCYYYYIAMQNSGASLFAVCHSCKSLFFLPLRFGFHSARDFIFGIHTHSHRDFIFLGLIIAFSRFALSSAWNVYFSFFVCVCVDVCQFLW